MAAAVAAAFGSWFLASGGQAPAPVETPLTSKAVTTRPVTPEPENPSPPDETDAPLDPQIRAALEDKLAQAQEYQAFFVRMRALYPADYEATLKAASAHDAAAKDNAADLVMTEAVRRLRQTRGLSGAKAGGQALDQLFDLHLKVLRQLASTDPALCVDFLNGAPEDRFAAFTGANRALMAQEALAGLDAIDDGARKKIDREAPTPQDFDDLERLLLDKGLDKAAIDLLLDGKTPDPPLSDAKACQNGIVYLDVLKTLPDLQRLRLYALALEVMAHE